MRFYQFKVEEIVDETHPDLDLKWIRSWPGLFGIPNNFPWM